MGWARGLGATGACALVLGGMAAASPASKDSDVLVTWRGQSFRADGPPPALSATSRALIERWATWAADAEYDMLLDPNERVLLVTDKSKSRARRDAKLVQRTLELFDEQVLAVNKKDGGAPATGREPILLFDLADEHDYAVMLATLAEKHAYLTSWITSAQGTTGFTLQEPVCGAWLQEAEDLEEWRPENELVNRLVRLLLFEHFGRLPYWLDQGIAWYAESELEGGIYSFPYRTGFVAATEHTDWDKELKRAFRSRKNDPLRLEEITVWRRGTFHQARAYTAFGVAAYFAEHRPGELRGILASLAEFHEVHGRQSFDDGSWQRLSNYVVPAEDQMEIFQEHAGLDFLEHVTKFLRKGSKYREPRRRRSS